MFARLGARNDSGWIDPNEPGSSYEGIRGRVAEWFKAAVLKTAAGQRLPWVRIPPLPPIDAYLIELVDVFRAAAKPIPPAIPHLSMPWIRTHHSPNSSAVAGDRSPGSKSSERGRFISSRRTASSMLRDGSSLFAEPNLIFRLRTAEAWKVAENSKFYEQAKALIVQSMVSFLRITNPMPEFPCAGSGTLARIGSVAGCVTAAHVAELLDGIQEIGLVRYNGTPQNQALRIQGITFAWWESLVLCHGRRMGRTSRFSFFRMMPLPRLKLADAFFWTWTRARKDS
jgi:hypothetical protein